MEGVTHHYLSLPTGVRLHYVEWTQTTASAGCGSQASSAQLPPVVLCHGWPDFWFTWRHQIKALGEAGHRVIAPDLRGFGESQGPHEVEAYGLQEVTGDLVALLDVLDIAKAVFIGHDWGGAVVWAMAVHHSNRVLGVAALNTPFYPPNPERNPLTAMMEKPGNYDYQLYFMQEGVAEAEFERDVEYALACLIRSSHPVDVAPLLEAKTRLSTANVRERGGMLVGFPPKEKMKHSVMFTPAEFQYYADTFKKSGFRGGLNWYRNVEKNWRWNCAQASHKIYQPCLMITAGKDRVLPPSASKHMERWIPRLSRHHIEECAHWTQQEHPQEVNRALLHWLNSTVNDPKAAKL